MLGQRNIVLTNPKGKFVLDVCYAENFLDYVR